MSKLTGVLIFATGFLGGSASAYFALKKRFDILLAEEIESVKGTYEKFNKENLSDSVQKMKDALGIVSPSGRMRNHHEQENQNYEKNPPKEENAKEPDFDEPYLIPPTEFNEIYGYETSTLTLYSDGTIADEDMEIVEDADDILGEENLQQLKDGEADCIYIRNDSKYSDYEILRDYGTFEDAVISQNSAEEDYE